MMTDTTDEFAGQGGSYVADAETGKRVLIERTQEAAPAAEITQPNTPETAEQE